MTGKVVGIAIKEEHRAPLVEVETAEIGDEGFVGNVAQTERRQITVMARENWEEVQRELEMDLPWPTRRANILVEGLVMLELLGKSLKIGEIELCVEGETVPCDLMDTYLQGLKGALVIECRGGVHTRVISGGKIHVGDTISVVD